MCEKDVYSKSDVLFVQEKQTEYIQITNAQISFLTQTHNKKTAFGYRPCHKCLDLGHLHVFFLRYKKIKNSKKC